MGILNSFINKIIDIFDEFFYRLINLLNIFLEKINSIRNRCLIILGDIFRYYFILLTNFSKKYLKLLSICIIVLIVIIGFYISNTDVYYTYLFYPNREETKLIAEKRAVFKKNNKIKKIKSCVQELLLGPFAPGLNNIFPKKAKLLSVRLEGKIVFLNFSRETVMDVQVEKEEKDGISIYYLLLESIVNSICFEHRDIDRVKFSFGGKEYRYIGNFGPIDKGLKPDWRILMR